MVPAPTRPATADSPLLGGCQCGAVRYSAPAEPLLAAICHCTMCRRAGAAPAVAWAMYREDDVVLLQGAPTQYRSSDEATRQFCGRCGTQLFFTGNAIPGLIDITVGSLDDPERVAPALHYWYDEHLSWMRFDDSLPKFPEFPPQESAPE